MPHVADEPGELAVQYLTCLLCEMSPLLWIMSGRRHAEHYTTDTVAAWRSGPRLPMAVRAQHVDQDWPTGCYCLGLGFAARGTKMKEVQASFVTVAAGSHVSVVALCGSAQQWDLLATTSC